MRLALACLLACAALNAQAQSNGVYKWKDAKGVTHYSDTPPPDGRYGNVAPDAAWFMGGAINCVPRAHSSRSNTLNTFSGPVVHRLTPCVSLVSQL